MPTPRQDEAAATDRELIDRLVDTETRAATLHRGALATALLDEVTTAMVTAFAAHHDQHAAALQAIVLPSESTGEPSTTTTSLAEGGTDGPTSPPFVPLPQLAAELALAADALSIVTVLGNVEEAMTATHLDVLSRITDADAAMLVASIAPVEAGHATLMSTLRAIPLAQGIPAFGSPAASALDG